MCAASSLAVGPAPVHVVSASSNPATEIPGHRGTSQESHREAHVSAQHPSPSPQARLPRPDAHPSGPGDHQVPASQGPRPPHRLIGRIHGRTAFERLARSGRSFRTGTLWCRFVNDPQASPLRVGFSVARSYGRAVERNRLRRRLRVIVAEVAPVARPHGRLAAHRRTTIRQGTHVRSAAGRGGSSAPACRVESCVMPTPAAAHPSRPRDWSAWSFGTNEGPRVGRLRADSPRRARPTPGRHSPCTAPDTACGSPCAACCAAVPSARRASTRFPSPLTPTRPSTMLRCRRRRMVVHDRRWRLRAGRPACSPGSTASRTTMRSPSH